MCLTNEKLPSLLIFFSLCLCVQSSKLTLVCEDPDCWMSRLPLTSDPSAANCTIYSQGEFLM